MADIDKDAKRRARERPYHGPVVMFSNEEAKRCARALAGHQDVEAVGIRLKVAAAVGSDPKWAQPLK